MTVSRAMSSRVSGIGKLLTFRRTTDMTSVGPPERGCGDTLSAAHAILRSLTETSYSRGKIADYNATGSQILLTLTAVYRTSPTCSSFRRVRPGLSSFRRVRSGLSSIPRGLRKFSNHPSNYAVVAESWLRTSWTGAIGREKSGGHVRVLFKSISKSIAEILRKRSGFISFGPYSKRSLLPKDAVVVYQRVPLCVCRFRLRHNVDWRVVKFGLKNRVCNIIATLLQIMN